MIQTFTSHEAIERHFNVFPFHQVTSSEVQDSFFKKQKQDKINAIKRLDSLGSRRCKLIQEFENISGIASVLAHKIASKPHCLDPDNLVQFEESKKELSRIISKLQDFEDDYLFGDLSGSF